MHTAALVFVACAIPVALVAHFWEVQPNKSSWPKVTLWGTFLVLVTAFFLSLAGVI